MTAEILTPEACREARRLLGWHQQRLALQAGSCLITIAGFESRTKRTRETTLRSVRSALEDAGVEFGEDGAVRLSGGAPVRPLRPSTHTTTTSPPHASTAGRESQPGGDVPRDART
jgi:hypothetical protein